MRACLVFLLTIVAGAGVLAQTRPAGPDGATGSSDALSIAIEAPAQRLEAGRDLGFVALLTNNSDYELRVRGTELTLTVPLALDPTRWQVGWHAFFPTLPQENQELILQPGATYRAFWTINRQPDAPNAAGQPAQEPAPESVSGSVFAAAGELLNPKVLFFEPGDYSVTVNGQYWTMPDGPYRTVTTTSSLPVAAPMLVVLVGAAAGGVISFLLMPAMKLRTSWEWKSWSLPAVLASVTGALGTALLSVIVTILLSRISGTEFFLQVTVNDVWGAVAVGFFSPLAAGGLIRRITGAQPNGDEDTNPPAEGEDKPESGGQPRGETQP